MSPGRSIGSPEMELRVLYEDEAVLVCHKRAGIATQTGQLGQQDMESLLRNYRSSRGEETYIGIVHRLDQPVEGVMVFAKNRQAASQLSVQIREQRVEKRYYAVSCMTGEEASGGEGASRPVELPKQGTLVDLVDWDRRRNLACIVENHGKKAVLDYAILAEEEGRVLFDIALGTGRRHQIRVQLAHRGFPILGDGRYGGMLSGGDDMPGGTLTGGDGMPGGTLTGGDGMPGGTLTGGDGRPGGTLTAGDGIYGGTLHGGDDMPGGTLTGGDGSYGGMLSGGDGRPGGMLSGGDGRYGGTLTGGGVRPKRKGEVPALCAYRLAFDHPATGRRMEFSILPDHPAIREMLGFLP